MRKWNGVKVTEVAFKEVVSHINVAARSLGGDPVMTLFMCSTDWEWE